MTPDALRARLDGLTVWRRGGQRAPHKPLLLLLALARFASGEERLSFSAVEAPLRGLLRDFGPARAGYHPQYPFWRLQNDGLWQLGGTAGLVQRSSNADPTLASLRAEDPVGRFPDDIAALLRARPECIAELAESVLAAHFPDTLHDEILAAVASAWISRRSPATRAPPAAGDGAIRRSATPCCAPTATAALCAGSRRASATRWSVSTLRTCAGTRPAAPAWTT